MPVSQWLLPCPLVYDVGETPKAKDMILGVWSYFKVCSYDQGRWVSCQGMNLLSQEDSPWSSTALECYKLLPVSQSAHKGTLSVDTYQIIVQQGVHVRHTYLATLLILLFSWYILHFTLFTQNNYLIREIYHFNLINTIFLITLSCWVFLLLFILYYLFLVSLFSHLYCFFFLF